MVDEIKDLVEIIEKRRQLIENGSLRTIISLFISNTEVCVVRSDSMMQVAFISNILKHGTRVTAAWPHPKKEGYESKEVPSEDIMNLQSHLLGMETVEPLNHGWLPAREDLECICNIFLQNSETMISVNGKMRKVIIFEIDIYNKKLVVIWPNPFNAKGYSSQKVTFAEFLRWQR